MTKEMNAYLVEIIVISVMQTNATDATMATLLMVRENALVVKKIVIFVNRKQYVMSVHGIIISLLMEMKIIVRPALIIACYVVLMDVSGVSMAFILTIIMNAHNVLKAVFIVKMVLAVFNVIIIITLTIAISLVSHAKVNNARFVILQITVIIAPLATFLIALEIVKLVRKIVIHVKFKVNVKNVVGVSLEGPQDSVWLVQITVTAAKLLDIVMDAKLDFTKA